MVLVCYDQLIKYIMNPQSKLRDFLSFLGLRFSVRVRYGDHGKELMTCMFSHAGRSTSVGYYCSTVDTEGHEDTGAFIVFSGFGRRFKGSRLV
jgi:hypothetical protein